MGQVLRSVGSIAAGFLGAMLGPAGSIVSKLGFATATILFNVIFGPKEEKQPRRKTQDKSTAVGTALPTIFGQIQLENGAILRCQKDSSGRRSGIRTVEVSGDPDVHQDGEYAGAPKQRREASYLNFTMGLAQTDGEITIIDRIVELNNDDGEKVIFDRFNSISSEDRETLEGLYADLAAAEPEDFETIQGQIIDLYESIGDGFGLTVVPIFGPVSGQLIGELSQYVRMMFGSEEQPTDTAEETWYEEGVSADRGIVKIIFNDFGPAQDGTQFRFLLRNSLTNRRQIITKRLLAAGVPQSRINLRSIDPEAIDFGWWSDGVEPARDLAEMVAAKSIHDLHFMPVSDDDGSFVGLVFTDVSRASLTWFRLETDEMGAFVDSGGEMHESSSIQLVTNEDKPRQFSIAFKDRNANFKDSEVVTLWPSATGEPQSAQLRCAAGSQEIADFCDIMMNEVQAAEGTEDIALMPGRAQIACGCGLIKPDPTQNNPNAYKLLRVVKQQPSPEGVLLCSCVTYDPAAFGRVRDMVEVIEEPPVVIQYGIPQVFWLDGVSLFDEMSENATVLVAVINEPDKAWRGARVVGSGGAFTAFNAPLRALTALTTTEFEITEDALYRFDTEQVLGITVDAGASGVFASASEEDVRSGANIIWLGSLYVGYQTATPTGANSYNLSGLWVLRGSEDLVPSGAVPIGSRVVQITDETGALSPAITVVDWAASKVGVPVTYEAYSLGNAARTTGPQSVTIAGNTLKALSPYGVDSFGDGDGGLYLRFFGRTRTPDYIGSWVDTGFTIPMSDPLKFRLRLKDESDAIVETVDVVPTADDEEGRVTYHLTQADLEDIFGVAPANLSGDVAQRGVFGLGFAKEFENA